MDIRTALEKNPNGLTLGQLLTMTGKDFRSITRALHTLPIEEHQGRYHLVLSPEHRAQLRASFNKAPVSSPSPSTHPAGVVASAAKNSDDISSVAPTDSKVMTATQGVQIATSREEIDKLILAEPTWTPDMDSELLNSSELVAAVLAGEPLQVLRTDGRWINFKYGSMTLSDIAQTTRKIRKSRPTATICNVQINLGETSPLKEGMTYYTPCIYNAQLFSVHKWVGSDDDLLRLDRHIVHLKPIDAQRHAAVLLGYSNRCAMHLPSS